MADPRSRVANVGALSAFLGGIGFIMATPRIWPLAMIPAAILTLLLIGFTVAGVWGAAELNTLIFGHDRGTWGAIGYWSLMVLFAMIAFLIALVFALALAEPLSAFALERISLAQQRSLTGFAPESSPSLLLSIWLSLCCVSFSIFLGGATLAALFVVNFFFPPAVIVTFPLKLLVCSWMIAWNLLDYPLGLRSMGLLARLKWVGQNFAAFTLFGFLWSMIAIVPGIILVLLPMGVAGATRLVLGNDPKSSG